MYAHYIKFITLKKAVLDFEKRPFYDTMAA